MMRWLPLLLLTACGPRAFIEVNAESALSIPDATDNLDLSILPLDSDDPLAARSLVLEAGDMFPLRIVLEPNDDAPRELRIHLVATLAGEPVAAAGVRHTWVEDRINVVPVVLEPLQ